MTVCKQVHYLPQCILKEEQLRNQVFLDSMITISLLKMCFFSDFSVFYVLKNLSLLESVVE